MEMKDPTREQDGDEERGNCMAVKNSFPLLKQLFHIHGKVGEGTFSSVFLATLRSSDGSKKFALKHLIPTRHPEKIERELQCMQQIGGRDYVVGLDLCLRNFGTVIFVMPYMRYDKFSEYVQNMSVTETRDYMRALLIALRRVHKFNIIHRDIKPSNFLYDRKNKRYLLVDFGLAQEYVPDNKPKVSKFDHSVTQSAKRKRTDENSFNLSLSSIKKNAEEKCFCFGKPRICSLCSARPEQAAPRAGTPGFRAPEVLLKYPSQTPAIDMWASGIILLCILSGTHPFFHSPDDCTALAEITTIFGSNKVQQCAQKLGKKIIFNDDIPGVDIVSLCQKLQMRNKCSDDHTVREKVLPVNLCYLDSSNYIVSLECLMEFSCLKTLSYFKVPDVQFPKEAYQLLMRLLDLDSKTRITAEEALDHPFLKL